MIYVPVAHRAEWRTCSPRDGWPNYVDALSCLGMDMARAVPRKVREEAIPPLTEQPTSSLLIGDFSPKTTTKERTLNHGNGRT